MIRPSPATWSADEGTGSLLAAGIATALAIGLGAAYLPLVTLGAAAAAILIAIVVGNLTYGVAVFTLLTFFEVLPGVEGVALSKPVGLILVVSWVLALVRDARELPLLSRGRPVLTFALAAFVGWGAMSAAWAFDSAAAVSSAVRLSLIAVLVFVLYTALRTPRDLVLVAWMFLTGAFLVSVVAIATGGNKAGRLALGELDPNTLAAAIAGALVLALFLLCGASRRGERPLLLLFMSTYVVALMLTESRGGIVAAALGAVAAIVLGGPFRARIVPTVLIIAALGFAYYAVLAPSALHERVSQTVVAGDRDPRLDSWSIAWRVTELHPVGGVGLGNFTVVEESYLPAQINLFTARKLHNIALVAHNTYLEILSELGIVGLALFGTVVLMTIGSALKSVRAIDAQLPYTALTIRGLIATLLTLLAAYFFVSETYGKQLWLLLGVLAAAPTIADTATRSRAAD